VRLEKLTIYEITEAELEALEQGSPESLFLNLCIATVSIATSFFLALLTNTFESNRVYCVFVVVCVIGLLAAVTFGLLWWKSRHSVRSVAREIRRRKPPEGVQEIS
jgi:hypothetical protein